MLTETKAITDSASGTLHQFVSLASYDAMDRVRSQHYPADNQGTVGEEVSYSYQSAGALLTTVSGAYTDSYAQAMTYNVFGQLTQIQYGTDPLTTQQYDYYDLTTPTGLGRLQQITTSGLQELTYTYDAVGNVLTIQDGLDCTGGGTPVCQVQTFAYDDLDRLTSAAAQGGNYGIYSTESYTYNTIGNITSKAGTAYSYQGDAPHAVTHLGGVAHFGYDANGNTITRTLQHDDELVYDAENRLVEVWRREGRGDPVLYVSYLYDGDGQRVQMNLYSDGFSGPTTNTTTYLGTHLEMEQGHSSLGSTSPAYTWYYYAGQKRIALRQGTSAPVWLLTDHLGSTSLTIDATGTRTAELRYKPWGETRYTWGSTPTDHRFTGQTFDSQIGLYYYGARYYDPVIGRFAQADILVSEPGNPQSLNRYAYVLNNPLRYVDPTGHSHTATVEQDLCAATHAGNDCYERVWYRAHGFERIGGTWTFTGNVFIHDARIANQVLGEAGITLRGQWTAQERIAAAQGVGDLATALGFEGYGDLKQVYGSEPIYFHRRGHRLCGNRPCTPPPLSWPGATGRNSYFPPSVSITKYLVVHELAHVIDWHSTITFEIDTALRTPTGNFSQAWAEPAYTDYDRGDCQPCNLRWETWAEGLTVAVYGRGHLGPTIRPVSADEINRLLDLVRGNR